MDILGLAYRDDLLITYHEYFKVQVNFINFYMTRYNIKKVKIIMFKMDILSLQ